jgi:ferredoxin
MIDRRKISAMFDGEIGEVIEDGNTITVKGADFRETIDKKDVLQQNCAVCNHRNPVIHDELVADPVEEQTDMDRYADVREIENLSPQEKAAYFKKLLEPCIRCYACRNACPLCYCPTCFTDESRPQWVGKSQDPTDVTTFHFLRAYHCAGRCTDCGACERSCPVGINMRVFTKKLEKDCLELFGWEAGLDPDVRPPLDTYKPGDPDDFIK